MNNIILFLITIGLLFSCNKKNEESELVGNWKLTKMSSSFANSETTGAEMEWQESYLLNGDGTFLKSRNRDGITTEVIGIYNLNESTNERLLVFIFNKENEIIGSCNSNLKKEEMVFQTENIFSSTWNACDGPSLTYEKQID